MFHNLQMTQQFYVQCLEAKAEKILMETEQNMKQNKLTLNEGKSEIMVFKNEKLPTVNCVEYKSHSLKPTDECRYLGVTLDKQLTYQKQLENLISKIAIAIRSIYLVRNQIPLKARIILFRSLVLSHLEFSAKLFQSLPSYLIDKINKQIRLGMKVCFFEQYMTVIINIQTYKNIQKQKKIRIIGDVEIKVINRTYDFSHTTKCKSKWSQNSIKKTLFGIGINFQEL